MNRALFLIVVPILGVLLVGLNGRYAQSRTGHCEANLKQLRNALLQYVRDYDEKFPPSGKWSSVLQPYSREPDIFDCPLQQVSYAYNRNLSGLSDPDVSSISATPCFFDSSIQGSTAADTGQSLPRTGAHWKLKKWRSGNNVIFYDGAVRWLTAPPPFPAKPAGK